MSEGRIVIVDDHELLSHTVALALADVGFAAVTITPTPFNELLPQVLAQAPDLVLLDLDLGAVGDGTGLIGPLTAQDIRVMVLTGVADRLQLAAALETGAVAIQCKTASFDELIAAIKRVARADLVEPDPEYSLLLKELAAHRAEETLVRAPFEQLTEREQETLRALASGLSVSDIAARWVVAEATVRSHVRAILYKLDASSQLQAVVRAVHAGWVVPEAVGDS